MSKTYKKKICTILLIAFCIIFIIQNNIYGSIVDPITDPSKYDPTQADVETSKIANMISILFGVLRTFGIVVAVISLVVIGYKFMMGSVEDRAKYKETLIPYIIGFVLTVSILVILEILFKLFFNI